MHELQSPAFQPVMRQTQGGHYSNLPETVRIIPPPRRKRTLTVLDSGTMSRRTKTYKRALKIAVPCISLTLTVLGFCFSGGFPGGRTSTKTLVIVMGTLRGGDQVWYKMIQNLLVPQNADLALFTPPHEPNILDRYAKYNWVAADPPDLESVFNRLNPTRTWHELCEMKLHAFQGLSCGPFNGTRGASAVQLNAREMLRRKLLSCEVLKKYDWFILTRADYMYLCPFVAKFADKTTIYTPDIETYEGVNDRFAVVHKTKIIAFLNVTRAFLNSDPSVVVADLKHYSATQEWHGNPETVLHMHLKNAKLSHKAIPHVGFTLRRSCDDSSWSLGEVGPFGYYVKYPNELARAEEVCNTSWAESQHFNMQVDSC